MMKAAIAYLKGFFTAIFLVVAVLYLSACGIAELIAGGSMVLNAYDHADEIKEVLKDGD